MVQKIKIYFLVVGSAKRTKGGPQMVTMEELRDIRSKTIKGEQKNAAVIKYDDL